MEAAGGAVDERRLSPPFINSIAGTVGEPSGVLSSLLGSRRVGIGEAAGEGEGGGAGSSFFDLRSVRIMMGVPVAVVVLCCALLYTPTHTSLASPNNNNNYNNLYPDGCACCCFLCCWWFDFGVTNTGLRLTRILKKETGEFLFREIKGDPCVVVGGWNGRFL